MGNRKVINNENGFIKFTIVLLVLFCFVYLGIKFGMPYYRYSALKSDAKELARISITLDRTKAQVYERALELKIPIDEEDIKVIESSSGVRIEVSWSETVDLFGLYQKTLYFDIDVTG